MINRGRIRRRCAAWLPAIIVMALIFVASSRPAERLPDFGVLDRLIKKTAHVLGYGLLALTFRRALILASGNTDAGTPAQAPDLRAWLLAGLYAVSDEVHQAFVPGRQASVLDVVLFDAAGAALALGLSRHAPGVSPGAGATVQPPQD